MSTSRTFGRSATGTAAAGATLVGTALASLATLAIAPAASGAENPAAYVGERGIVVASDRNVNVREPGEGRSLITREASRVAYAAGERVVYETADGRVKTRDLEQTVRLQAGPGIDRQKLLGAGQVGRDTVAVLEEQRVPRDGDPGAYRSDLVAFNVITGERTVLSRGLSSFEGGYTHAHVFEDGSVVAAGFQSVAIFAERYEADGTPSWSRRIGSDEVAELAVIRDRVTIVRTRSRGGDTVLRIVRLDPGTGERRGARSVRLPDAGAAPFCRDWRTTQRLLCQTNEGAVVIDTIGEDTGVVNRIKAPSGAYVSVIGGR